MTRGLESLLRRTLLMVALCLILGGAALTIHVFLSPPRPIKIEASTPFVARPEQSAAADPKISRLMAMKMSRTVTQKVEVVQKPPAPNLSSLVRVKGIMDFGNPKTNEAIIEIIRSNQ